MSSSGLGLEDLLIPLEEIRSATKDFSQETLIGRDRHGNFYKGQFSKLLQNRTATIKRYDSYHGKEEFFNELNLISKFDHENINPFIGYCDEGDEMIIVSVYAINGSLADHLEDPNKMLSMPWPQRLKICIGAAKAINYLHIRHRKDYVVIHNNIKADAILLDENMEAKIGSFALAIEVGRNQQHIYKSVGGTFHHPYIDPIYRESGILKKETDVYSFGVVMFELLSGTLAFDEVKIGDDKPQPLINLVRRYYNIDGLEKLIASQIRDQTNRRSLDTFKEIAYRCISHNLNKRPSMDRIVKGIAEALDIHNYAAGTSITIRSQLQQNLENLLIPLKEFRSAIAYISEENEIGYGGSGRTYKGQLSGRWENRTVAIKLHNPDYLQQEQFQTEVPILSLLRHKNIIKLIGYCEEDGHMILIYEYAVNGSLFSHLYDPKKRSCLTWKQRLKICIGATRGLEHLHASLGDDKIVVHGNIETGTILLDGNMEPLITCVGLSKVVDRNQGQVYDEPAGNSFYMDVYSLGVVLFEMLSGMLATDARSFGNDEPQFLINLVRRYSYDDGVFNLIDPLIKDQIDIHSFLIFSETASKCISLNLKDRPSLNRIIKRLEEALLIQEQGDALTIVTRNHLSQDKKLEDFRVPLKEIQAATGNFSFETLIGKGGFSAVYMGESSKSWQNCKCAIKRLVNTEGRQGKEVFRNELELILKFRHQNIINFLGYCDEDDEMIIVNEYASNGSLDSYLEYRDKRRSLTWVQRLRICLGTAKGLDYLHWGLGENNRVIHRDVKSGNILLDDNLEAKLCDFGLSKSGRTDMPQSKLYTKGAGTQFYMDPVNHESGMLQKESDVYSLGVVLFEMLTGMLAYYEKAIEKNAEPQYLINLVRRYFDDGLAMLIDPFIKDQIDRHSFHTFKYIAYECISLNPSDRPTMDTIIERLEEALEFQVSMESQGNLIES